jgi:hypothetical protein
MDFQPLQRIELSEAPSPTRQLHASAWHAGLVIGGAAAGGIAFNIDLPSAAYSWSVAQGFLLAAAILAIALRFCRCRSHVPVLLLGWYLGSMAALPYTWHAFFGSWWGWLAWLALSGTLAFPALLAPRRRAALGLVSASLLASVPPLGFVGLCNPLLTAGALLPHGRWLALLVTLLFFGLSAYRHRGAAVAQIVILAVGLVMLRLPAPAAPSSAWPAPTFDGPYPTSSLAAGFKRQDQYEAAVIDAIDSGAKLIILPEGTNPLWDDGQAFYWQSVTALARQHHVQVLLGVYTNPLNSTRTDGLVDLGTGRIYPAMISMPIAMWQPWLSSQDGGSFPLHFGAVDPIATPAGPAAHLICYEELLLWPLAAQEAHTRPALLISVANQWFASGWTLRAQERSAGMQARLWGLPLLRAVNHAPL